MVMMMMMMMMMIIVIITYHALATKTNIPVTW